MAEETTILIASAKQDERYPIHYIFRNGYVGTDTLEAEAEITDHYVEDNTAVQDHMTIKPLVYTLRGYVGEKVFSALDPYDYKVPPKYVSKTSRILGLTLLAPELSSYAQTAIAAGSYIADRAKDYFGKAQNIVAAFSKNKVGKTIYAAAAGDVILNSKQELAYQEMILLRDLRTLVNIESPYGLLEGFLVQSARIEQVDTKFQSELVVTLKEFRSVGTSLVAVDYAAYEERYAQQVAAEQDVGKIQGKSESSLRSIVPASLVPKFTGQ